MFELLSSIADAPPAVAADRSTALVAVVVTVAAVVAADAERQSADRSDHLSSADAADLVVAICRVAATDSELYDKLIDASTDQHC